MKKLHERAFWLFFISKIGGSLAIIIFLLALSFGIPGEGFLLLSILGILFVIAIPFILAKLEYRFYMYDLTENGFQKEYGIIAKKYVTIPYERIQNIDMSQTVIERLLGLYNIDIQTAGSGSAMGRFGGRRAEGSLPGLDRKTAEDLRDELIKRSRSQDSRGSF